MCGKKQMRKSLIIIYIINRSKWFGADSSSLVD